MLKGTSNYLPLSWTLKNLRTIRDILKNIFVDHIDVLEENKPSDRSYRLDVSTPLLRNILYIMHIYVVHKDFVFVYPCETHRQIGLFMTAWDFQLFTDVVDHQESRSYSGHYEKMNEKMAPFEAWKRMDHYIDQPNPKIIYD